MLEYFFIKLLLSYNMSYLRNPKILINKPNVQDPDREEMLIRNISEKKY
jgi:hypothetical protein